MSQYVPMYDSYAPHTSDRYVPSSRMSVSNGVYLPDSDMDFQTGKLKPNTQKRTRMQGKRIEYEHLQREEKELEKAVQREVSKGGVRVSVRFGIFLIALSIFLGGLYLLIQQGVIADRQKAINRMADKLTACRSANAAIETQISDASDKATICYAAARDLNMIPAETAKAIHLVAMDTRPDEVASQAQAPITVDASAAMQVQEGVESTHVPMRAGN
ncbi:MAG: hypothetical protein RR821_00325 [Clostridia bacterium]